MKAFQEKVNLSEVVPYLELPSNKDGRVNLWDLKQRSNLIIFFHHGINCAHCERKLKQLAEAYPNVKELEAEVLAVSFDSVEKLKEYSEKEGVCFHLFSDLKEETTQRFTYVDNERNAPFPSIFITDRFGVLRYQKIAHEANELPDLNEILSWLLLIETECPECSHL